MIVEGVRDDGALLLTHGLAAATILGDRVWLSSRASALSKGTPWVAATDQSVPARLRHHEADLVRLDSELT